MDREQLTPAQRRLLEELLAVDAPRPAVEPGLAARLRRFIEHGIQEAVDVIPAGERLVLHKSALAALACDGRYLDLRDTPFSWSVPVFRGKLAHLTVELDWKSGRSQAPDALVDRAWERLAEDDGIAEFLGSLDPVDAGELRSHATHLLMEMRDTWPPIPLTWSPRLESSVGLTLASGAVSIRGKTDLMVGRVDADQRQVVVVDLKTGWRRPLQERQELRLYALLLTLKWGVEPFRLVTYYVTEGAWDHEDVTPGGLEAAARQVVDSVVRAARLTFERPADEDLRLQVGAYCAWCGRRDDCPAYAEIGSEARAIYANP